MGNYVPLKKSGWLHFLGGRSDLTEYPVGRARWKQLALLVIANVIFNFQRMRFSPLLGSIMDYFDISKSDFANMLALAALFYIVAPFIGGPLADRFVGRKNVIVWGIFLYCLSSIWLAMCTSWFWFVVVWVLSNVLIGAMLPAMSAAVRDYSPRMSRGLAFGIFCIGWGAGNYLVLWFAALLLPHLPTWQGIFYAAAALGFLVWLLLFLWMRDLSPAVRHQIVQSEVQKAEVDARARGMTSEEARATFGRMTAILKIPRVWSLVIGVQFWGMTYLAVSMYAPLFFRESFGMTEAEAASSVSWFWPAWTASAIFWGWFSDKIGTRKLPLLISCVTGIAILSAVIVMIGRQSSPLMITLMWAAVGLLVGPVYPMWITLYSENLEEISPYAIGTGFAIQAIVGDIGMLIKSFYALRIVEAWGWGALWGTAAACLCIVPFSVIAGTGSWLPERWKRKALYTKVD